MRWKRKGQGCLAWSTAIVIEAVEFDDDDGRRRRGAGASPRCGSSLSAVRPLRPRGGAAPLTGLQYGVMRCIHRAEAPGEPARERGNRRRRAPITSHGAAYPGLRRCTWPGSSRLLKVGEVEPVPISTPPESGPERAPTAQLSCNTTPQRGLVRNTGHPHARRPDPPPSFQLPSRDHKHKDHAQEVRANQGLTTVTKPARPHLPSVTLCVLDGIVGLGGVDQPGGRARGAQLALRRRQEHREECRSRAPR